MEGQGKTGGVREVWLGLGLDRIAISRPIALDIGNINLCWPFHRYCESAAQARLFRFFVASR